MLEMSEVSCETADEVLDELPGSDGIVAPDARDGKPLLSGFGWPPSTTSAFGLVFAA